LSDIQMLKGTLGNSSVFSLVSTQFPAVASIPPEYNSLCHTNMTPLKSMYMQLLIRHTHSVSQPAPEGSTLYIIYTIMSGLFFVYYVWRLMSVTVIRQWRFVLALTLPIWIMEYPCSNLIQHTGSLYWDFSRLFVTPSSRLFVLWNRLWRSFCRSLYV
jgi:hypothetical protein